MSVAARNSSSVTGSPGQELIKEVKQLAEKSNNAPRINLHVIKSLFTSHVLRSRDISVICASHMYVFVCPRDKGWLPCLSISSCWVSEWCGCKCFPPSLTDSSSTLLLLDGCGMFVQYERRCWPDTRAWVFTQSQNQWKSDRSIPFMQAFRVSVSEWVHFSGSSLKLGHWSSHI